MVLRELLGSGNGSVVGIVSYPLGTILCSPTRSDCEHPHGFSPFGCSVGLSNLKISNAEQTEGLRRTRIATKGTLRLSA